MPVATFSFRVAVPLYEIHGATLRVANVAGLDEVTATVRVVRSGVPFGGSISGAVSVINDDAGVLHNTRFDVVLPGRAATWLRVWKETLVPVVNRVIDDYRVITWTPRIRRIPWYGLTAAQGVDDEGGIVHAGLGWEPGDPSTDHVGNAVVIERMERALAHGHDLPVWSSLLLDAWAEYDVRNLMSAILLANSSMETLFNHAFRAVAPKSEVDAAFNSMPPASIWQLAKSVNSTCSCGFTNRELLRLVARVHRHRDDVSHGNPVPIDDAHVGRAVESLRELVARFEPAVRSYLQQRDFQSV